MNAPRVPLLTLAMFAVVSVLSAGAPRDVSATLGKRSSRDVTVLGAVHSPGTFQFPKDVASLDLLDLIVRVGGFTASAKTDAVSVIRHKSDGTDEVHTIDVARTIVRRRRGDPSLRGFPVFPGDRIWVPSQPD